MKPEHHAAPSGGSFKNVKEVETNARSRMDKVLTELQQEMAHIRTGRASIGLLDSVRVDYYGSPVPLNQVAQLHVPEPAMITVQPWDTSTIGVIEKAIRSADLGLNPSNDGKVVRVPIPSLTEDRRKDLVKHVHKVLENHRTALRNVRRDVKEAVEKLEKDKKIGEDDRKRSLDELEKLTQAETKKMEDLSTGKEKELLDVK